MIADPFATHLPVLSAIGRALPIRSVLEFGAGQYSTPEFLNRNHFPFVERVVSYESSQKWADTIAERIGHHETRLTLSAQDAVSAAAAVDLDGFDLIFIDNGQTADDRIPVIRTIARRGPAALVVIHDFEQGEYQQAAAGFAHVYFWRGLTPWTAVLWNGGRSDLMPFEVSA